MYLIALVVLCAIYVILHLRRIIVRVRVLSKIPGPNIVPILGNTKVIAAELDKLFRMSIEDCREYFPIFKYRILYYHIVFTIWPDDIEALISKTRHLTKSNIYDLMKPWLETGLLTSADAKWKNRRKILTPTFHFNILQQFVATFLDHSTKLCDELEGLVDRPVDVVPIISKHTLHIISETAMGTNFEGQESDKYRNAIHKIGKLVVERSIRPWLYSPLSFMLSPIYYKTMMTTKYLRNYTSKLIRERESNFDINQIPKTESDVYKGKTKLAMLDMMLHAKMTGADIDDHGIREEVNTFLFEGHDTTSNCVSFTLLLLANNPDIQRKVMEELEDVLPTQQESMNYGTLNNMYYLDRVIKESLRMYPSVPAIGRITSEQITTPSGYVIPEGVNILIKIYEMHRHHKFYPDPDKFDPDRFLPENIKERHPYAYIPFSAGPRNCIDRPLFIQSTNIDLLLFRFVVIYNTVGQKFAILEVKTVVASILRRFELFPVDTPDTIILMSNIVLRSKNGVRIMFRRRSNV